MAVDPSKREAFLEYLVKEHPEEADKIVYQQNGPQIKIPFKSPMLTWATVGGMPIGHIGRWYGPEGSGKSLTNWGLIWAGQNFAELTAAWGEVDVKFLEKARKAFAARKVKKRMQEAINRFPNGMEAIIFDTEQRADRLLAAQMGVDNKRVEIVDLNVIEEIIKDATVALEAFHIIIIDSATNAQSIMEANLEPGAYEQGTGAKAWSRLKQFRKKLDRKQHTLIIVDQVRSRGIGQGGKGRYSGPETAPPNVRFLRHNASLALEYSLGKALYLDKHMELTDDYDKASTDLRALGTDGKEKHGLEMRCKVIKNSTGRPDRNSRMRFRFPVADRRTGELVQEIGFDDEFELLECALYFDLMEKSGSFFYPLDTNFERLLKAGKKRGRSGSEVSYQGEAKARQALRDDEDLIERILTRLKQDM